MVLVNCSKSSFEIKSIFLRSSGILFSVISPVCAMRSCQRSWSSLERSEEYDAVLSGDELAKQEKNSSTTTREQLCCADDWGCQCQSMVAELVGSLSLMRTLLRITKVTRIGSRCTNRTVRWWCRLPVLSQFVCRENEQLIRSPTTTKGDEEVDMAEYGNKFPSC